MKSPKPWSWDSPSLCSHWPSNETDWGPSWYYTDHGGAEGAGAQSNERAGDREGKKGSLCFPGTWTSAPCRIREGQLWAFVAFCGGALECAYHFGLYSLL